MDERKIDSAQCGDRITTGFMLFHCCSNIVPILCYYYAYTVLIIHTCYFRADVDECKTDLAQCGDSAYCTNTVGSYICNCKQGYVGIGNECNGKYITPIGIQNSRMPTSLSC